MTSSGTAGVQISETSFFHNVEPTTSQKTHGAQLPSSGVLRRATPLVLYYSVHTGGAVLQCTHRFAYTPGEVTSQNLWPRYDRHFVGITWHNVWS